MKHHDWQLTLTRDWLSMCIGGTSLLRLHPMITSVQTQASNAQEDTVLIWDILASFLDSVRKWRCIIRLYIQSMEQAVNKNQLLLYSMNRPSLCSHYHIRGRILIFPFCHCFSYHFTLFDVRRDTTRTNTIWKVQQLNSKSLRCY